MDDYIGDEVKKYAVNNSLLDIEKFISYIVYDLEREDFE